MVNYGGDEVAALVVDIGSSSIRVGYAGDDTPKAVVPTQYGYQPVPVEDAEDGDAPMADGTTGAQDERVKPKSTKKLYIGQHGPSVWRAGMEIGNPLKDGLVEDFDIITEEIRHAFTDILRINSSEHPVFMTEPAWNTPANRERMAEIMFEEFQVPAFYIANTGVLNAFAAGKGTAMVIDVGHDMASVTPVVDGFVLRKGLFYSSLPRYIRGQACNMLKAPGNTRRAIDLFPHQLIASKIPVEPGTPPQFSVREDRLEGTASSWKDWYEARETDEWIQSGAAILDQGWNDQAAAQRPAKQYEFPTGYNCYFGPERYSVGERLFFHPPALILSDPSLPRNVPAMITEALRALDPDLRQVLIGSIVVTGGGSLFTGFSERLNNELVRHFSHAKIHAPGNPTERRYGAWLGGSILGSLGTFHQLWISQEEWKEHGKAIVGQRCK